jgi:hypothetical protein
MLPNFLKYRKMDKAQKPSNTKKMLASGKQEWIPLWSLEVLGKGDWDMRLL